MTIPRIQPVTVQPRTLNLRLWELRALYAAGTITPTQTLEYDVLCNALETGQDNECVTDRNGEAK
jgi:hypothetical protein